MTFGQIKEAIKDLCNLRSDEADARVTRSVIQHYKQITSELGMDATRFVSRTATMVVGVKTVTFSNIERIDRLLDTTSGVREVTPVSLNSLRTKAPGTGQPEEWAPQSTTATTVTILTDTAPQTAYTLTADGAASLSDPDMNDEPVFAESYHNILVWKVVSEELLKKEKTDLADTYETKAVTLQQKLVFQFADSPGTVMRQGNQPASLSGGTSGGGGSQGGVAYTQTALITFDRGAGIAPFAVAQADAAMVANLDADKLDGQDGAYYLTPTNLTPVPQGHVLGRSSSGAGTVENVQIGTGLQLASGILARGELLGDVTAPAASLTTQIASGAVTTAKILDGAVTLPKLADLAISTLIGRGSGSGAGDPEAVTIGTGLTMSGSTLIATPVGTKTANTVYAGPTSGTPQDPAFRSLVAADLPAQAVRVLDQNLTQATVVNSVAEQTVYSFTVPANTMGTRMLRLTGLLESSFLGAGTTVNVRLNFGGTTFHSGTINIAANSLRSMFLQWHLQNLSTATQTSLGRIEISSHAGATVWQPTASNTAVQCSGTGTIDTAADRAIAVTLQLDVASTAVSVTAKAFTLELV